ncbi:MAG: cytochrome c-type biogenesis protein CcmH [Acidimicrobiales bacterium]|nr:cytochrome c-type biogenesis protein CcmH [Acidimicrobiales bacterium]
MKAVFKWGPWAVLVAVAAVVLAFGLSRSSHPSLDARVQHIAGLVRCPTCNGESAAVSQSVPAGAIRAQIRQDLQAGQSQGHILQSLVQSYGPSILEKPGAAGIGLVVWVLPVVGFVAGAAGLTLAFMRWRGRPGEAEEPRTDSFSPAPLSPEAVTRPDSAAPPSADAEAGALEAGPPEAPARPRWSRRRWAASLAGAAVVAAGVSWAVVASSGTRLPGQEITGQSGLSAAATTADLQAADRDAAANRPVDAIKEYQKVLKADPNQTQALTGEGWLLAQTQQPALLQQGLSMLARAENVDPTYAPAHVYRGIALLAEADYADSVPELQWYLAHSPDPQLVPQVQKALTQAQAGVAATKAAQPTAPAGTAGTPSLKRE